MQSPNDQQNCVICLHSYENKTTATLDCCDHQFCVECILNLCKVSSHCPIDRKIFKSVRINNGDHITQIPVQSRKEKRTVERYDFTSYCEICNNEKTGALLMCDACDLGFHTKCLYPPIRKIPAGHWYCSTCRKILSQKKVPKVKEISEQSSEAVKNCQLPLKRKKGRPKKDSNSQKLSKSHETNKNASPEEQGTSFQDESYHLRRKTHTVSPEVSSTASNKEHASSSYGNLSKRHLNLPESPASIFNNSAESLPSGSNLNKAYRNESILSRLRNYVPVDNKKVHLGSSGRNGEDANHQSSDLNTVVEVTSNLDDSILFEEFLPSFLNSNNNSNQSSSSLHVMIDGLISKILKMNSIEEGMKDPHYNFSAQCKVCKNFNLPLLLCDKCELTFHKGCVSSDKDSTSAMAWCCPSCSPKEFPVKEGKEHENQLFEEKAESTQLVAYKANLTHSKADESPQEAIFRPFRSCRWGRNALRKALYSKLRPRKPARNVTQISPAPVVKSEVATHSTKKQNNLEQHCVKKHPNIFEKPENQAVPSNSEIEGNICRIDYNIDQAIPITVENPTVPSSDEQENSHTPDETTEKSLLEKDSTNVVITESTESKAALLKSSLDSDGDSDTSDEYLLSSFSSSSDIDSEEMQPLDSKEAPPIDDKTTLPLDSKETSPFPVTELRLMDNVSMKIRLSSDGMYLI